MIHFGYNIQRDRQIDYDTNNLRILNFIRQEEPSVDWCMSCGTCASGCTAAMTSDYSLRRLILLARRGEEEEIFETVNRCRFCGKCIIACPRDVNTRNIVFLMQYFVNKISSHETSI
jgi:heterodisulfide reductase subunit C